jgi:transposase
MRLHGNARTCLHSRGLIVERVLEQGWTVAAAAEAAGVSVHTAAKWLARYRCEGSAVKDPGISGGSGARFRLRFELARFLRRATGHQNAS